jgi:hypothetical protein
LAGTDVPPAKKNPKGFPATIVGTADGIFPTKRKKSDTTAIIIARNVTDIKKRKKKRPQTICRTVHYSLKKTRRNMTLIRKPAQLDVPKTVKAMIYGQAGTGKTTLALSAPSPLLLDFDGGNHRVNFGHQCDTLPVRNWTEAVEVLNEDLNAYGTIVIDTVGKMMDFLTDHVEKSGAGGWKKWEKINEGFASFTRKISGKGKHVIFVAHRDTRREGEDSTVFVPALREKNYTAIVTELDLLGYVEMKGSVRTVTFNPTSRNDGKNTCNLPGIINLPTVVDRDGNALQNTFFQTHVIAPYIAAQRKRSDMAKAYDAVMNELKENILLLTDEVSANDFVARIEKFEHVANSKAAAGQLLAAKAKELGLRLNKEKRYEKVNPPKNSLL